ncbi:hypothetical protein [Staphylococcus massiliensis]|uniref:hypothetical protein n=1 Tax=Staphylococcus massiliensis TaxID=555791 RepID=UPI0002D2CDE0|nr:hypothetical protein [Staphylococcus massiliensis]MCG3400359.1 hypothetical protein [Staphylococcus massiliensis]MCG3401947.1 hypothetical protein [Staphylococcus massiliensis]MCG3412389.1 hypothetical protein [Staphylococcus massiliensis]POA00912.1 hypothetical protein CD133_03205 [Staphylococcus massiliensis CCUG 55927]
MYYEKQEINTKSDRFLNILEDEMKQHLKNDETLITVDRSKKRQSFYITIMEREKARFITFRISDHRNKIFYKPIKSFFYTSFDSVEYLMQEIRVFLDNHNKDNFNYEHYFLLRVLYEMSPDKVAIRISDTKLINTAQFFEMKFKQEVYRNRILEDSLILDGQITKILRILLQYGLVDHIKGQNVMRISKTGFRFVDEFRSLYERRFVDDYHRDLEKHLVLPTIHKYEIDDKTDLLIDYDKLELSRYYVYALYDLDRHDLLHIGYSNQSLYYSDFDGHREMLGAYGVKLQNKLIDIREKGHLKLSKSIIMNDLTEREASKIQQAFMNHHQMISPSELRSHVSTKFFSINANHHGNVVPSSYNHFYGIGADLQLTMKHETLEARDIIYNVLVVKVEPGEEIKLHHLKNPLSSRIQNHVLCQIETSESRAKKIDYILAVHPHNGIIVAVYKVNKKRKQPYIKEINEDGKTKYKFNFKVGVKPMKTFMGKRILDRKRYKLLNYSFMDAEGKMKDGRRRYAFIGFE